jgi:GNAT superfamily N-acetyltransferase
MGSTTSPDSGRLVSQAGLSTRVDGATGALKHAGRRFGLSSAGPGDHPLIHNLLLSIFHAPSAGEFFAQLEAPQYEPTDRLLIRRGQQIVAHVRLAHGEMQFGPLALPVCEAWELATLPEFRGRGCASALLEAAERKMVADGALLGLLRTRVPSFFAERGWVVCGRHSYSLASTRDILAHLGAARPPQRTALDQRAHPLNIRLWRLFEQPALMRLYSDGTQGLFGPPVRTEAYWRWLIGRHGYERLYVAIHGPDRLHYGAELTPIVGYAAVRQGRVVELMNAPGYDEASPQLLARACADAIERGFHTTRLDAPPAHRLHQAFVGAGGEHRHQEADGDLVFMAKALRPIELVERMCGVIHQRVRAADAEPSYELGLLLGGKKLLITATRRGAKLIRGKLGRSYLSCSRGALTQLALGHLDAARLAELGRLEASTRVALETAAILFPRVPLWYPPLDALPV